ncbi:hypothetical protein AA0119_g10609 [Alternaria tenuissima]|uniref:Uncharacterized protein n=1 Tax=Alternaria tenuissima TaxID=119927 RepID=A0ABY0FWL3_9PLEO|nr:hypothetical protein AA0119_g10609 [Alternaria tenuissima]RYO10101.1 hypothetical protein AA0121_g10600 [Alternaria tenuissima]
MRFIVSVFTAVAVLATFTIASDDGNRIVWHERPVREQWGCVTTCRASFVKNTEFYRTQCAVCMDRIRNTVCLGCADAFRAGRNKHDTDLTCKRCRHISDYDSTSDFTDDSMSDKEKWEGPLDP